MTKLISIVVILILLTQSGFSKDIELILYKGFLQRLVNKIFPVNLTGENVSTVYKVYLNKPVLSIQPKYIQIDSTVNISSVFGHQMFPSRCKLVPIYNSKEIELKVIEGKVDLRFTASGKVVDLGTIDLSQYISNIKIPLDIDSFNVRNKTIKSQCRNVRFQLLKDKVIVHSEVILE